MSRSAVVVRPNLAIGRSYVWLLFGATRRIMFGLCPRVTTSWNWIVIVAIPFLQNRSWRSLSFMETCRNRRGQLYSRISAKPKMGFCFARLVLLIINEYVRNKSVYSTLKGNVMWTLWSSRPLSLFGDSRLTLIIETSTLTFLLTVALHKCDLHIVSFIFVQETREENAFFPFSLDSGRILQCSLLRPGLNVELFMCRI